MLYRLTSILTLLFGFSLMGLAQEAQPTVDEEMRVNLVELEVKVKDLAGRFVSDLNKEDFTIREDGEEQTITDFKEVELFRLPEEEIQDYRSRVMILLDFRNTQYNRMAQVFDELNNFVDLYYTDNTELGLAVNADGIVEIQPFTRDREQIRAAIDAAEAFHKSNKERAWSINDFPVVNGFAVNGMTHFLPRPIDGITDFTYTENADNYYRTQIDVLGQFVRYTGAYKGKKNIVMVTDSWLQPTSADIVEGDTNKDSITSLRDIQTTAMKEKVAVNVISIQGKRDLATPSVTQPRVAGIEAVDRTADLATTTSGYFFQGNHNQVDVLMERSLEHAEHYYRIRYYTDSEKDAYRDISVAADGINRIAQSISGYYPQDTAISPKRADALLKNAESRDYSLKMDTEWLRWDWTGVGERKAHIAVAMRAYDANGRLLAESVKPMMLSKAKQSGEYLPAPMNHKFSLKDNGKVEPILLETEVTDLSTGQSITLKRNLNEDGDVI